MTVPPPSSLWPSIVGALLRRQTWALEAFLASQAVTWGAWVANPWSNVFDALPELYSVLAMLPEWFVGGVFVAHGLLYGWALWRGDVALCRRAALVNAGLWILVLTSFLMTVPWSTGTPIYACSALASVWVYVRLHWRFA